MMTRSFNLALVSAAIFLVSAASAGAQDMQPPPRQGPSLRMACGQELQTLCPGLTGRDARQCLRAHRPQLSAGCIAFFQGARARRAAGATGAPPAGGPPPSGEPAPGPDGDKE
jgi:hypothetical protein